MSCFFICCTWINHVIICVLGAQECPLYPTELAFALDVSSGVSKSDFDNMKDIILHLLNRITITESNCPRGARVALTLYNSEITTDIRFSDALKKRALLEQVRGLQTLRTNKKRNLETAMNFLAQNTFKRVRSGFLVRKLAIFFVKDSVELTKEFTNAALRLYDAGITTVFLMPNQPKKFLQVMAIEQKIRHECNKYNKLTCRALSDSRVFSFTLSYLPFSGKQHNISLFHGPTFL